MPYGLQNPELMLKFGLRITQSRSHFETSYMTYGLCNPKVILELQIMDYII